MGKNEPKTNPIKANFKKAKMNVTVFYTKGYENKPPIRAPKKRTQSNPISKAKFEKLKREGFLTYVQPDLDNETYPCNLSCSNTCPMEVVEMEGKLFAICSKDTEIDPIPLTKDDISKYRFSLNKLVKAMRKDNGFTGNSDSITPRIHLVGGRVVKDVNTAFGLALFPNIRSAEPHLLSLLARIPSIYLQTVVITPSLNLNSESIYSKLRAISIFPVNLPLSFGRHDCKINYLAALRKRLPAGISSKPPGPTDEQLADIDEYAYLCQDHLHIPGTFPRERSNDVSLNGHKLSLADSLFALLLRFVVELKKGEGGWVSNPILYNEGFINDRTHYQSYSNLRAALQGSLLERDGKKFIEASRSKTYRISTHPDFVTYDKKKLLNHHYPDIEKLAGRLP